MKALVYNAAREILLAADGLLPEADSVAVQPALRLTEPAVVIARSDDAPAGMRFEPLRNAGAALPPPQAPLAAKGIELLEWLDNTRYCSRCGAPMQQATEISRRCTQCGREVWPSVSPAILVLVTRNDTALLVQARNFTRPFHGLVAGFVETGESLEQCVRREVKEETGLEISHIRYFGSQPWPFPANLMVGFTARYAGGELTLADHELKHARFYSRHDLPELPTPPSLARTLIDAWAEGRI